MGKRLRNATWYLMAAAGVLITACSDDPEGGTTFPGKGGAGGAHISTGGAGGSGAGGYAGNGGSGSSGQCTYLGTPTCTQCVQSQCGSECAKCTSNSECVALISCLSGCGTDVNCLSACPSKHPGGVEDMLAFNGKGGGCVDARCSAQCSGSGGGGGTGGAGGGGWGGSSGGGGGSSGGWGGSSGGGAAEDVCVSTINALRTGSGLQPLARWFDQEACADAKSQAYAGGTKPGATDCGAYGFTACSHLNGPDTAAAQSCINMLASDPQSAALLKDPTYTQVACGFYTAGSFVYTVQFFK